MCTLKSQFCDFVSIQHKAGQALRIITVINTEVKIIKGDMIF